jgi:hypothetical protein
MAKRKTSIKSNFIRIFRGRPREEERKKEDPTPIELPAGYMHPTPLPELIARMVKEAIEEEKGESYETIEDADDFDVDDDDLLDLSPYELTELHDEEPLEKPTISAEQPAETPSQTPSEAPQETITPPEVPPVPEQVER